MTDCRRKGWPQVAVGAVVFREERVLLVCRGTRPARGDWAIPGGKVKAGETLKAACEREILEETGIRIRAGHEPVHTFELIEKDDDGKILFHYVIIDYEAEFLGGRVAAGDDAADAMWVSEDQLDTLKVNAVTRKVLRERFEFG